MKDTNSACVVLQIVICAAYEFRIRITLCQWNCIIEIVLKTGNFFTGGEGDNTSKINREIKNVRGRNIN
jgi:hypothetical protein